MYVLRWTMSLRVGATHFPARSNGDEGGTAAGTHANSVGTRLSTLAWYSSHLRPSRSAHSTGPVTTNVCQTRMSRMPVARSWCRRAARSPAVVRSRFSCG